MSDCIEPTIGGPIQVRKGYPHVYKGVVNGKQLHVALRREMLEKKLGRPPNQVGCTCRNYMCINPEHLFETTPAEVCSVRSKRLWVEDKAVRNKGVA